MKPNSIVARFLDQPRFPIFTCAAVLLSLAQWLLILADLLTTAYDWGGLAQVYILFFLLSAGSVVLLILAVLAAIRREYCGGRVAVSGVAFNFATVLAFYFARGHRLWR